MAHNLGCRYIILKIVDLKVDSNILYFGALRMHKIALFLSYFFFFFFWGGGGMPPGRP